MFPVEGLAYAKARRWGGARYHGLGGQRRRFQGLELDVVIVLLPGQD